MRLLVQLGITSWVSRAFTCSDGCSIADSFQNDDYCDCSDCGDEFSFSCGNCQCPTSCGDYGDCGTPANDDFACDNGCMIPASYYSDDACDCPECEDEPNWTCQSCPGCTSVCGEWTICDGVTTTTPSTDFECNDGCLIDGGYYNDGGFCDCPQCEDEPSWSCASCPGCPTACGNWIECVGTTEKPTTTTKKPTTTLKPTTTTEKPTTTVKPTTTTTKPMTTTTKPTTTLKPTTTTLKPTTTVTPKTTTLKPTTTVKPSTTETVAEGSTTSEEPIVDKSTSTELPHTTAKAATTKNVNNTRPTDFDVGFSTKAATPTSTEDPETGSNGGDGSSLLFIAGGGFAIAILLSVLIIFVVRRRRKKKANPFEEAERYQAHMHRILGSNSEVGDVMSGAGVEMVAAAAAEMEPGAAERRQTNNEEMVGEIDYDYDYKFVPGSRRVSKVMRSSVVALSADVLQPGARRISLVVRGGAGLKSRPPPVPRSVAGGPPPLPRHWAADAEEGDYTWQPEPGAAAVGYGMYSAAETPSEEGHKLTAAAQLEGKADLNRMFLKLQVEARTDEEIKCARNLRLALELAPQKMEQEFQSLVQMGVDTHRITEMLTDKAEVILIAHGYEK